MMGILLNWLPVFFILIGIWIIISIIYEIYDLKRRLMVLDNHYKIRLKHINTIVKIIRDDLEKK